MAQFLIAKFLSQALEWKARFPTSTFYAGLRYEPFIYEKARKTFPNYSKLYPDNNDFTQKFVRDLRNKDAALLKTINPDQFSPELETANIQFETGAKAEQQMVAQTNPQEVSQPFNLLTGLPRPKIPAAFANTAKNFGSRAGIFFKRNAGKYLTLDRVVTGFTTILGGIVGKGLAGNPGALAGAGIGALTPSFVKTNGTKVLGRIGNGVIDAGSRFSNQLSNHSLFLKSSSKKAAWAFLGAFLLLVVFGGVLGGIGGPFGGAQGEAAPIPPGGGTQPTDCPIPNGVITCGSQFTPVNNCGHCSIGYGPVQNCSYEGTKYSIDIAGQSSQQIILPKVNAAVIQWVWKKQELGSTQAIQIYIGTEVGSNKQYYLQFHHTQPGSGKGGLSGEAGGNICTSGCNHVHVQIGSGGDNVTTTRWFDAAQLMCR